MMVPAGTPRSVVEKINKDVVTVLLHQPEVKQKFVSEGAQIIGSTPEELKAYLEAEITRWARVVKEAGIRADGR